MISRIFKSTLIAAALLTAPVTSAFSSNVSEWVIVQGGAVRLLRASEPNADGIYRGGIEFRLESGWHTYWRYPGEAGIPTEASFVNSVNVAEAEVLFPAPETYNDGFSTSLIYTDKVILPVLIKRFNDGRPAVLNADLTFGICKDICIPGQAEVSMILPTKSANDVVADKLVQEAFAKLPIGQGDMPSQFSATKITGEDKDRTLTFTAKVPRGDKAPELFVEGPAGSYHGVPLLGSVKKGKAKWSLPYNGLPEDVSKLDLRLTLVTTDGAYEETQSVEVPQSASSK
ncbi:protein-disulfide reductase DsbD domain-containing protein [Pseudovibrio sp. Tun.PSC04-5.I4]|uniref:protein-disulfide reductase DsbD domain-containing protein n=1 Tax=Pseudovibrio sp. Tun.PSC04-5.I4 TaxID=1798213 RepID=UPI00088EADC0|nr:protein-disulfide reductase DsbD domain-containing protein [Pseudovibrio sp. Tun.PSC04-5.I4]SDQ79982.1 Thiol-disulfide interchange protein, contains DsbC and DsbD domains [Pseudovibrio sp. Tun.PSC04-5.I4]